MARKVRAPDQARPAPSAASDVPTASLIFHVCSRDAARLAKASGSYSASSLDSEGFIHFSQAHQVRGVLQRYYADTAQLVLLVVDTDKLTAPLVFEPAATRPGARGADAAAASGLFPHLYGPLNADAIMLIVDASSFDAARFADD